MIKKDGDSRWMSKENDSSVHINKAIKKDLALMILNFEKDFILCTFASDYSYTIVLTQKGDNGEEYPIDFMSSGLEGVELKYPPVDK
jgi:hypothetical protein